MNIDFEKLSLSDFEDNDHTTRKVYLLYHGVKIELSCGLGKKAMYNFSWEHGAGSTVPASYGQGLAELWACIFVWLYKYKNVKTEDADTIAHRYVYACWMIQKANA